MRDGTTSVTAQRVAAARAGLARTSTVAPVHHERRADSQWLCLSPAAGRDRRAGTDGRGRPGRADPSQGDRSGL